jgi:NADH pyrophosphatase NudC (nudix superfamily)
MVMGMASCRNCIHSGFCYLTIRDEGTPCEFVDKTKLMEVVHGHWCWEGKFKACSECGSYVEWDETLGANFWKFCPYCGAKMDGGFADG